MVVSGGGVNTHCPMIEVSVVAASPVGETRTHRLPKSQQPFPREAAHWNWEGAAQRRGQQASPVVVVVVVVVVVGGRPRVMVTVEVAVVVHWYWEAAQGEPQREPRWQQPPKVVFWGLIMQLDGLV